MSHYCELVYRDSAVLLALVKLADSDGVSWSSSTDLAEATGLSVKAVKVSVKSLDGDGLVEITRSPGLTNRYRLRKPPISVTGGTSQLDLVWAIWSPAGGRLETVGRLVLTCFARHADENGRCCQSVETISEETRLSTRAVKGAIAKLLKLSLISRRPSRFGPKVTTLNRYHG
jgi:DNA-binding MarR family transcriptional regulator